jgi:xanthine dehydrogenase accessory factor
MREILEELSVWRNQGKELVIASVVQTWGSSPRQVGSKMLIAESGEFSGSVSAGCVEGAVITESQSVIKTGKPRLLEYGVTDELAWSVNLLCGGNIRILLEPFDQIEPLIPQILDLIRSGKTFALLTQLPDETDLLRQKLLLEPSRAEETLAQVDRFTSRDRDQVRTALMISQSGLIETDDNAQLFLDIDAPRPRLIMVGAVHISQALIPMAKVAGFSTILIDPRRSFATTARFAQVDRLINEWPQDALPELGIRRNDFLVLLSHDPKLDDPALVLALNSRIRYIGALGSRQTQRSRLERLKASGFSESQLKRIKSPAGLNLKGRTPGEIAVSILAEVVLVYNQPVNLSG